MHPPYYREYELPWTGDGRQDSRFRRLLLVLMAGAALAGLAWPFLPVPEHAAYEAERFPLRIATLLIEQALPPPTPPPVAVPPERLAEAKPTPMPTSATAPKPRVAARDQARAALLPFTEDFAALVDHDAIAAVADRRLLAASVTAARQAERSLVTSSVGQSSGGINTASLSRNTGGAGLSALTETVVERPVASLGERHAATRRAGRDGRASRSREEIELVFDRHKGAIFALYNRALRLDPMLGGKLVLRLTIAPSGQVDACEIVSSELGDPDLERKLVQRVMLFRFESKDVEPVTTTKPIDFFPA